MAILVFLLGLILIVCGAGGVYASIDLVPTEIGLLYAGAGAVALCSGLVTVAIGLLVLRVDRLARTFARGPAQSYEPPPLQEPEPLAPAVEEVARATPEAEAGEDEAINENRVGRLPSLDTPEAAPTLVGRYSAGGANYMIFSDGSIEAETGEGTFKFASMGEFKRHLAAKSA